MSSATKVTKGRSTWTFFSPLGGRLGSLALSLPARQHGDGKPRLNSHRIGRKKLGYRANFLLGLCRNLDGQLVRICFAFLARDVKTRPPGRAPLPVGCDWLP